MKKRKLFYFSVSLLAILIFIAIFAPLLAPYDPQFTDISQKLQQFISWEQIIWEGMFFQD